MQRRRTRLSRHGPRMAGKSLLIRDRERGQASYGIYQVSFEDRQRLQLTKAPSGIGDWRFSVSPDGKSLAFVRYERRGVGDLYVISMKGGTPHRLTNWNGI